MNDWSPFESELRAIDEAKGRLLDRSAANVHDAADLGDENRLSALSLITEITEYIDFISYGLIENVDQKRIRAGLSVFSILLLSMEMLSSIGFTRNAEDDATLVRLQKNIAYARLGIKRPPASRYDLIIERAVAEYVSSHGHPGSKDAAIVLRIMASRIKEMVVLEGLKPVGDSALLKRIRKKIGLDDYIVIHKSLDG